MSSSSVVYGHLPFMRGIHPAAPPDFSAASWHNIMWCQFTILDRMPLFYKFRAQGVQGNKGSRDLSSTYPTSISSDPAGNHCLPLMRRISFTPPPHFLIAAWLYLIGCQVPILFRMPFFCKLGMERSERSCSSGNESATDGTWSISFDPVLDTRLPLMGRIFSAAPPHFFVAP